MQSLQIIAALLANCFVISVYAYIFSELVQQILFLILMAAYSVPPTSFSALLFHFYFGFVFYMIFSSVKHFFQLLFFKDMLYENNDMEKSEGAKDKKPLSKMPQQDKNTAPQNEKTSAFK
jgi:hypothetical protein